MTNLSRGGVFIATDRPAEIGTRLELRIHIEDTGEEIARLELRIHIEDTGEEIDVPGQVVSQNVGPNFESGQCGMGLRFLEMKPEVGRKVEALYERKLKEAAERKR
jgi:Tfp pilus assembly protein PilZ